jgi:hypothetical protein
LFWDFKPPVPPKRNIPLKGDLIVKLRLIILYLEINSALRDWRAKFQALQVLLSHMITFLLKRRNF